MSWINISGHFINLATVTSFSCQEFKYENDMTYLEVIFYYNSDDHFKITLDDYGSREDFEARFVELTGCVNF